MKRKKNTNTNTFLQKKELDCKTLVTQKDNTYIKSKMNPMCFSMNDLLGQRKKLKKAKKRKKIADNDNGFFVSSTIKQSNSNVLVPTLQDIIGSMKSLKSTGIKLH